MDDIRGAEVSRTYAPAKLVALAVSCGLFMELTDTSALATALPTLVREFHVDVLKFKLVLTAYLIVAAMLIPLSGWLADRYGARRVFLTALSVFLLGSTCCALANSFEHLVLARILQALGGGLMTPVGRQIVARTAPRNELVNALNWFTIPAMIGPLIGPPLAGLLIEFATWRWLFLINIPVGVAGFFVVRRLVPPLALQNPGRFDAAGAVLAILGVGSLMGAAELIGRAGVPLGVWLPATVLAAAINTIMVRHMLRTKDAILDVALFRIPSFRATILGGGAIRLGLGALPFLLPLLLQSALGWSPFESGLVMLVAAVGSLLGRFVGPTTIRRMGFRATLVVFALGSAISASLPALFRPWTPGVVIFVLAPVGEFLRVTHFIASSALTYSGIPPERSGRASTLSAMTQQLSLSIGVSFGAVALSLSRAHGHAALTANDFILPFLAIGAAGLLALPEYLSLPRDVGAEMRMGGRPRTKAR
ncbi:MAG TPA: MFS transporter [Phenylobacterium sp.]|jgi:EmrB/QacA subfamily drug resistance transporter|uniref:MFS transporter n=1 Tax=Phenylobacterium sp. TaxID=1871053 RepID=UPI002BA2F7D9|nr:MFS transporter [Phenylobacterium sp.]HXA37484.1 MFS transporter [Phenylobacterium sp.]